jgi:hypothetical protein
VRGDPVAKHAARLLRLYPKAWRARYGDEFLDLLIADLEERPHCWRRTADVALHGLLARVSVAGVPGTRSDPGQQIRAGLVAVGCTAAAFLSFGIAMWSQVVIGWRWRPPATPAVAAGMLSMSVAMLLTGLLLILAGIPLFVAALRALSRREVKGLVRPGVSVLAALALLVVGGLHFDAHWPGSGGRPWGSHGLVPSRLAAFCWAVTRGISSYWFHPHALTRFDNWEISWMAVSLGAIVTLIVGLTKIVRRLSLSPRVLRFEALLARGTVAVMGLFAAGAAAWVVAGRPVGPTGVYQVGAIDVVGLTVMGLALLVARHALARMSREMSVATRSDTV